MSENSVNPLFDKHEGGHKEWTFGGFLIGFFIATIFWNMFWMVGPRYVILNDGTIIETRYTGEFKWVEVGEKTIEVKTIMERTIIPTITWGADCVIQSGKLTCTSGGTGGPENVILPEPKVKTGDEIDNVYFNETEGMEFHNREFHGETQ